jgi:hypothetical protein
MDKKKTVVAAGGQDEDSLVVAVCYSNEAQTKKKEHFLGFEEDDQSSKLRELWHRWKALENWIELAIRPRNCHPDDRFLLSTTPDDDLIDDLPTLKKQCQLVQTLFNDHLSTLSVETTSWESSLVVRPSQIPGGGMGLYYQPEPWEQQPQQDEEGCLEKTLILPGGSVICYYTGHVHTHSSARALVDKSYLMWIRGNTLVDPRPLPHIKARYANDPLTDSLTNCAFVPIPLLARKRNSDGNGDGKNVDTAFAPHEDTIRTSVVTTRDVLPGEELFVQYGDTYWNQQPIAGIRLVLGSSDSNSNNEEADSSSISKKENIKSEGKSEDEYDDIDNYIDETFPFSPMFQSKLTNPIIWENAMD